MTAADVTAEIGDLCALPTAARPLRAAEFDDLFRHGVVEVVRIDDVALDLLLDHRWRKAARDLARRETACCSFFTFAFRAADDKARAWMRIAVPTEHVRILDAVAESARAARG